MPPTSTTPEEPAAPVAAVAAPSRLPVHAVRGTPLTAYQLTEATTLTLLSDVKVYAHPGMWVVSNGPHVIDVLPEALFKSRFEPATTDGLVIDGASRAALEKALGFGSTKSAGDLVTVASRLARLSVGDIAIDFSPGQWDVLAHRAQKRGISVEALVRQIVDKLTADIWEI